MDLPSTSLPVECQQSKTQGYQENSLVSNQESSRPCKGVSHDFELIEKEESNNVVELGLNDESADNTQMLCKTATVNAVTHDGIQAESVDKLVTAMHLLPTDDFIIGGDKWESDEEMQTKEVVNTVRGILNKLLPSNFDKFLQKIQNLPIDTDEQRLALVAKLFYEKAVKEPQYSSMYAKMCQVLSTKEAPSSTNPHETINFRRHLLGKCQSEFEEDSTGFVEMKRKKKEIEANEDESKKQGLEDELDELTTKFQKRSLGNIRFMGELFKVRILSPKIIHNCITHLLNQPENDLSLEQLCVLLTSIGEELDHSISSGTKNTFSSNKEKMDSYFNQLDVIVTNNKLSNETHIKIEDVIALRKNQWKPLQEEGEPNPQEVIYENEDTQSIPKEEYVNGYVENETFPKEAVYEHEEKEPDHSPTNPGSTDSMGGRDRQQTTPVLDRDDNDGIKVDNNCNREKEFIKSSGGTSTTGDSSTVKDHEQLRHYDDNLQLFVGNIPYSTTEQELIEMFRNCGNVQDIQIYGKNKARVPIFYAYVIFDSPEGVEGALNIKSIWKGNHRLILKPKRHDPPMRGNPYFKTATRSTKSPLFNPLKGIEDLNTDYSARSITSGISINAEEKIALKPRSVLCEFLNTENIENAVDDLFYCLNPFIVPAFINDSLMYVLEGNRKERRATGILFKEMVNRNLFTTFHILKGFQLILKEADYFFFDIPNLWEYLAQIIAPIFEEGLVNLGFLGDLARVTIPYLAPCLVAALLKELVTSSGGVAEAGLLWTKSNVSLSSILPGVDEIIFVLQNKELEFVRMSTGDSITMQPNLDYFGFQCNLEYFLRESERSTDQICSWITNQSVEIGTPLFIRTLSTAVVKSSINGKDMNCKLNTGQLEAYSKVLRHYIEDVAEREVTLLFAVQGVVTQLQHPKGLIQGILETLYEMCVISEEGVELWTMSKNPLEREGKTEALKSSQPFLTWLKETEAESEQ